MALNNFHTAMYQASILYNVNFNDTSEFEEIGLIAWQMIGNKNTRTYRFHGKVDPETKSIDLPCNCDFIEAVTTDFEDYNYTTGDDPNGSIDSAFVEQYIEHRKLFTDPLYISGKLVHYERHGNKLYFDFPFRHVNVLYHGLLVDEEGLPELNDKEVQAIATYVAYVLKFKEAIATNNNVALLFAQMLKKEWYSYCNLARTPEHIDQNSMNDILDAKTSWARKSYGSSYKAVIK